jgi:hypothetical protein
MRMKAKAIASILFLMFIGWQFGLIRGNKSPVALVNVSVKLASLTNVNSHGTWPVTKDLKS